jgi:antimicrobial peptide system SdpA family protein
VKALTAGLILVWSLWAILNLTSSLKENALHAPLRDRALLQSLTPQGWAFFTRNPREERTLAWMRRPSSLEPANLADYRGAPWNGVKRALRNRALTINAVASHLSEKDWQACEGDLLACVKSSEVAPKPVVLEINDNSGLCGEVVLQKESPTPWAWRNAFHRVKKHTQFARAAVKCFPTRRPR